MKAIDAGVPVEDAPAWAVLERRLLELLGDAVAPTLAAYYDGDGLRWPADGGGLDDAYECFSNLPLVYALGGDEAALEAAIDHWEHVTERFARGGPGDAHVETVEEYYARQDWMHMGEGNQPFYHVCLAAPDDDRFRERAERFAELYLPDGPGNYDPERILQHCIAHAAGKLAVARDLPPEFVPGDDEFLNRDSPFDVEGLVHCTLGGSMPLYNGGLLRTRVRHFDPGRDRPGLPPDVAALVTDIGEGRTGLELVNLAATDRAVVVQGGTYGEHVFGDVTYDAAAGDGQDRRVARADGNALRVSLPGERGRRWNWRRDASSPIRPPRPRGIGDPARRERRAPVPERQQPRDGVADERVRKSSGRDGVEGSPTRSGSLALDARGGGSGSGRNLAAGDPSVPRRPPGLIGRLSLSLCTGDSPTGRTPEMIHNRPYHASVPVRGRSPIRSGTSAR